MTRARACFVLMSLLVLALPAGLLAQEAGLAAGISASEDLSTLASLLEMAELDEPAGGLTLFAPSDEAFAELPDFAVEHILGTDGLLAAVLQYHAVPGVYMAADLTSGSVATAGGSGIDIAVGEAGVTVNDASVVVADLVAGNSVVHVIDRVLIPPVEPEGIVPAFVEGDIIVAGSSTVFPLSDAVAVRFRDEGYAGNITVDSIGSGAGFERFCAEGVTDISNASRPIRDAEVANCQAISRDVFPVRVGTDALAVVIHSGNEFVDSLTLEQLARVFSTADTWQDVQPDWPAEPIERFIPGTDSGTFDYFVEEVFDDDTAPILAAARTSLSEDDNVLVTGVAGNPYAVAFFGYAYYDANRDRLGAVPIGGVAPQGSSVDDGSYPLARPLFMYAAPEIIAEKPQVGDFLGYYLDVVNEEVGLAGYFPADPWGLNRARFLVSAAIASGG